MRTPTIIMKTKKTHQVMGFGTLQLSTMLVNLACCLGVGFGYGWGDE